MNTTEAHPRSRLGPLPVDIGRSVYGTVLVMTVLAIDTTHGTPGYLDAAAAVVGAMVATFLAHLFADVLSEFARTGGPHGAGGGTVAGLARVDLVFLALPLVALTRRDVGRAGWFATPTPGNTRPCPASVRRPRSTSTGCTSPKSRPR